MLMVAQWGVGRDPFPLLEDDNDYSGKNFDGLFIQNSKSLSHAFFNGVTINNSAFINCDLDQCEFGEAEIVETSFVNCRLDGTDLVRATASDAVFEECDFTDGEWRETIFNRVKFVRCKFSHTTVNLCSFYDCDFAEGSLDGLDYKAVNYNVFSNCRLGGGISSETVLSRNFGLTPKRTASSLVHFGQGITLEQVCLVSGIHPTSTLDLVRAVENECSNFRGRLKKLRLEFVSNIIRLMASQRKIAPSALIYIEGILSKLGATLLEEGDPQAILSAFVTVRNALIERVDKILDETIDGGAVDKILLEYEGNYDQTDGLAMATALDHILASGKNVVRLVSIHHGSTIFSIDLSGLICSAAAALAAINLLLSQATTSIKKVKALRKEIAGLKKRQTVKRWLTTKKPGSTPTLLLSGKEPHELIYLRKAVHESGMLLVRLDEPAKVTLVVREYGKMATTN